MTEKILEYLSKNPHTLPFLLMRKFGISESYARQIRSQFELQKDNASQEQSEALSHTHIA